MDNLDEQILDMLKVNSRLPFVDIANKLNISEGTVRARVKKLIKSNSLRFTIDYSKELKAIVMISVAVGTPTTNVANLIRNLGIKSIYEVSGQHDIVCFIESDEIENINDTIEKIRKITDIVDTNTLVVLK